MWLTLCVFDDMNFRREKVKRRKERGEREGDEPKKKEDKQQKPDLTKLSAHLPSGWQVYITKFISLAFCFVNGVITQSLTQSCRRIGTSLPKKLTMGIQLHLRPLGHDPLPTPESLYLLSSPKVLYYYLHF